MTTVNVYSNADTLTDPDVDASSDVVIEDVKNITDITNADLDVNKLTKNLAAVISGEMSFDDYKQMVRDAWYEEHDWHGWVFATYVDRALVHVDKKHWSIPFTVSDDDEVEFAPNNEWTEIEQLNEWVEKMFVIKSLGEDRFGGVAVLWGDETQKDLVGDYFTKNTEDLTSIFDAMGKLPFLVEHGADKALKSTVVAEVDVMESRDDGLWFEAKVIEHDKYKRFVKPLIDNELLFTSSGTLPHAAGKNKSTGEIKRWTIAEITGTVKPMEFRMLEVPIEEVQEHYKSIGLDFMDNGSDTSDEESDAKAIIGAEKARLKAKIIQTKLNLQLSSI